MASTRARHDSQVHADSEGRDVGLLCARRAVARDGGEVGEEGRAERVVRARTSREITRLALADPPRAAAPGAPRRGTRGCRPAAWSSGGRQRDSYRRARSLSILAMTR
ncbi:hypothetical protein GCM10010116_40340 [Microbispora rosea subsp. aerata]|nr:hypothetical protein GCM10010116_40340 [Microbispora rosea subsp. aerata]GIH57079.1 hypothetical protein Mro02_39930 [Microbispora rosea subsp. aerata]GLJ83536.1 hypothetical protein GCM10017588_22640 [Microbispora rosea subsp. aerata]